MSRRPMIFVHVDFLSFREFSFLSSGDFQTRKRAATLHGIEKTNTCGWEDHSNDNCDTINEWTLKQHFAMRDKYLNAPYCTSGYQSPCLLYIISNSDPKLDMTSPNQESKFPEDYLIPGI